MEKSKTHVRKKVKYTEMTVYDDLVVEEADTHLKSLGIKEDDLVYKHRPKECAHCKHKKLINIEVLGAYGETLFWECGKCESLFCKLPKAETEKYLKKGSQYWTSKQDWIHPKKDKRN
jgi:hypothetical protein